MCRIGWPKTTIVSFIFAPTELFAPSRITRFRRPISQWQAGQAINDGPWNVTLPGSLPDGDYDWLIGLFDAGGDGHRVPLQGVDDGTLRIRLGVLHLANAGTVVTFAAETNMPAFDPAAWYGQHLNTSNNVVDFGGARTDGSVWLHREGNVWVLKTWPRERNFTLEFDQTRFAQPATSAMRRGHSVRSHSRADRLAVAFAAQRRD